MAGRKDSRGRVLKQGECQRKDGRYSYAYTDPFGKRRYIYANDLMKLRSREQQLQKDQLDGLDIYTAGKATVNYVFDRYLSMKSELRPSTYTSYVYMYDRYVRDTFGKKLVAEVKYSDVMFFYERLMQNYKLQVGTVDKIHTLIHPIFKLAVRDSIIRINPADGCMAEIKKKSTTGANKRKALTIPQQKAFIDYTQHSEVYYRWAPLFTVLLGTGCRVGEIIGLRWEDVDFAERTININHSVSYRADAKDDFRCSYSVSKGKGRKQDNVSKEKNMEFALPLINCKDGNNGVMYYGRREDFTVHNNVLSIIYNGPPTEGQTYYQEEIGVYTDAYIVGLINDIPLDRELGLYLTTAVNKSIHNLKKKKYSRGNKATWDNKVENDKIILPIKVEADGTPIIDSSKSFHKKGYVPDWDYMRNYIVAIEKEVMTEVVDFKNEMVR